MAEKQCPKCKMMIDKGATKCPHCRSTVGTSIGIKILAVIFVIFGIVYMIGLSSSPPSSSVSLGSEGRLIAGKGGTLVPVAISEEALAEWSKARVANDDHGMTQMIVIGLIFSVENNTKVKVIDTGTYVRKVRILEGEKKGMSGWVAYERIQ